MKNKSWAAQVTPSQRVGITVSLFKGDMCTRTLHCQCVQLFSRCTLYIWCVSLPEAVQRVCAIPLQNLDLRVCGCMELLTETDGVPVANASVCLSFLL